MKGRDKQTPDVPAAETFHSLPQFPAKPTGFPHAGDPHSEVSLRRKAEAQVRQREDMSSEELTELSPETLRAILHDLRVHQIELEMQNEELRRVQAALEAERARYFHIFDLAPVGYVTLNAEGLILEANLTAANLLGMARRELTGKTLSHFILREDQDIHYQLRRQLADSGETQTCEVRMGKTAGTAFWAHLSATTVPDPDGGPACRVVLSDISERKLTELSLAETKALLQAAMDQSSAGIAIAEAPSGKLRYVNRAGLGIRGTSEAEALTGVDAEHYVASWQLLHLDGTPMETAEVPLARAVLFGEECIKEFIIRRSATEDRIVLANAAPILDDTGRVTAGIVVFNDITERKLMEEKLISIMKAVESTSDAVGISNAQGRHIFQNQALTELFGYATAEELQAAGGGSAVVKDPAVAKEMFETIMSGKSWTGELEMVTRSGRVFPAYERADAVLDNEGNVVGLIGIISDVTARKQAEAELQAKNAELERFLYAVSHDLKSPVVTIQMFLGYLQQDMANADAARTAKDLLLIQAATDKMTRMLNGLLESSRIGHVVSLPVRVTFRDLVDEALGAVAGHIAARGVTVEVGGHAVTLLGERLRLAEIWQNIIENACKFMGDQAAPRIEIGVEMRGTETVFFVRDNGIGLDPHHHAKIFNIFEKLDPAAEGAGLGLALIKRIVELYRGRIWIESRGTGQGACFYFTLPGAVQGG